MTSERASDFNNTVQFDQYCANSMTPNNTDTFLQQNNNNETQNMDSYSIQFAGNAQPNDSPRLVRQISKFQESGRFPVDRSNLYNPIQPNVGNVFNNGAALVGHDMLTSTQGPDPSRGSWPISNSPFQENPVVGLTSLVNEGQIGNIQGARQACTTLSGNSVTSVQNQQSSQGAVAPHPQQGNPLYDKVVAHIRSITNAKMDTEKKARALLMENHQLRTEHQQMQLQMQSYVKRQDEVQQTIEQKNSRLIDRISELENDLKTQTDQSNRFREMAEMARRDLWTVFCGPPSKKELLKARLDSALTARGLNPHGSAAQNPLLNQTGLNPVSATTEVTPVMVSRQSGSFNHQEGQPATPAIHNPLEYVRPAYAGSTHLTPPDTEKPQMMATSPNMSSLEALKPPADVIDLTLESPETTTPMLQIAANTTGTTEAPASTDYVRDHYVENIEAYKNGGAKKEPPWVNPEREKAREESQMQSLASEKPKRKRKAEAEKRPGKKAKTQQAVKATKPVQQKSFKQPRVPAKSKASANAKKHTAQPAADTPLLDREREEKEALEFAAELEAELDAEEERERQEFQAETQAELEAGAEPDLNAEPNKNKHCKPNACIDPALLGLNHDHDGQYADEEAEVTFDRPSSPADSLFDGDGDSLFDGDGNLSEIEDSGIWKDVDG